MTRAVTTKHESHVRRRIVIPAAAGILNNGHGYRLSPVGRLGFHAKLMKEHRAMERVKECMMVNIEYSLRTTSPDGTTSEMPPTMCSFVYGVDPQYPSVETALTNKICGDRVQVYVPPEELYGAYDETLVRELPRVDYKQERLQEGKMYREMRKKSLVQFLVRAIREDVIVADFNDPRAGSYAEFDILVKDVREASKAEMKPSCVPRSSHGCG
jgi:FKBP-type peptidyl-prolyl cis-trans isomerase SlyD